MVDGRRHGHLVLQLKTLPLLTSLAIALVMSRPPSAWAESPVSVEVAGLGERSSTMPIGEIAPRPIDVPGVSVCAIGAFGGMTSWIGASVGGNWAKIRGAGFQARLSYVHWTIEMGYGCRHIVAKSTSLEVGTFLKYGETNSWLENSALAESGPKTIQVGGGVRAKIVANCRGRLRPMLAIDQGVFRAHSTETVSGTEAAWIGGEVSMRVGLQLAR